MTTTSKPNPIPKIYEPQKVEQRLYKFWEEGGYFKATIVPGMKPFVIIMPPPNVTGELHVGHALTAATEDALARWHRMKGDPTLWLPGTDHAGIATQVVVERQLAAQKLDRHQLGREKFLERVWEWVGTYGDRITEQHRRLGASCDWSRTSFTMDDGPSKAVRTTFVNLYRKGLIYQGERLINWCPRCRTALSDLETEHANESGHLWHLRYPLADGSGHITVATTRPETYMGDTAVAVNPADERYRHLVGKQVKLPLIERLIPIVADEAIGMEFGTGALKVTPGHDPVDFEIGQRHKLPIINVMNLDATINENGGPYQGQDRDVARKNVVADFERLGLLEKTVKHEHSVGHCQRCKTVVEPLISKQWWVKVGSHEEPDSIAGRAYRAVTDGQVRIIPARFGKVYANWMENIRDWCISRQLWWGHRIPVWYCDGAQGCGHLTVAVDAPAACEACGSREITQDPDVLDTWFSSALWPHSTLGWPNDTEDLRYFYPTSVLETGYDILFFWVARMIMLGLENTGKVPFESVYLHGLIRDEAGEKMSKVKGNVVNPLEVLELYGTDALRFALTTGTSPGNDTRLTPTKMESARNFANKIWNASRFVLTLIDDAPPGTVGAPESAPSGGPVAAPYMALPLPSHLELEDRWILSRLHDTTLKVSKLLEEFQLGEAQREVYDFLWSEYADWYIELAKPRLRSGAEPSPLPVLLHVLEHTMRLLHPFMPFVTEEIWQSIQKRLPITPLPTVGEGPRQSRAGEGISLSIMVAPYPQADLTRIDPEAEREIKLLIDVVTAIRNARAELRLDPGKASEVIIEAGPYKELLASRSGAITNLAKANPLQVLGPGDEASNTEGARVAILGEIRVILPKSQELDTGAERLRIEKEAAGLRDALEKLQARLGSQAFTAKAPAAVIEKERARLAEYQSKLSAFEARLKELA